MAAIRGSSLQEAIAHRGTRWQKKKKKKKKMMMVE
jgi:hypothetical protein